MKYAGKKRRSYVVQVCKPTLQGPQKNPLKCEITVNTLKYVEFAELKTFL